MESGRRFRFRPSLWGINLRDWANKTPQPTLRGLQGGRRGALRDSDGIKYSASSKRFIFLFHPGPQPATSPNQGTADSRCVPEGELRVRACVCVTDRHRRTQRQRNLFCHQSPTGSCTNSAELRERASGKTLHLGALARGASVITDDDWPRGSAPCSAGQDASDLVRQSPCLLLLSSHLLSVHLTPCC